MDKSMKMAPKIETSTTSVAPKADSSRPSNHLQHTTEARTGLAEADVSATSSDKDDENFVAASVGILEEVQAGSTEVSAVVSRTLASQEQQSEMSSAANSTPQDLASAEPSAMTSTAEASQEVQVESTCAVNGGAVLDNEVSKPTPMVPCMPPKRGRGRPRKYPKPDELNGSTVAASAATAGSTPAATNIADVSVPSKRGRGVVDVAERLRRTEKQPRNRLLEMHPLESSVVYQPKRQRTQRIAYEPNFEPTYRRQPKEIANMPKEATSNDLPASQSNSTGTPKRARGRPKKYAAVISEDKEMPINTPSPVKRKRGRPPKHPVSSAGLDSLPEAVVATSTVTQAPAPAPKKRRGRPPKQPLPIKEVEAPEVATAVVEGPPIKKRRGRPPKQGVSVKAKTKRAKTKRAKTKRESPPKLLSIAPAKKKRGRPPKQPVDGPKSEPTAVLAAVPPVKRKRGRPRKNPPSGRRASSREAIAVAEVGLASPAGSSAITESTTPLSTPGLTSSSPVVRKRGRPRKKQKKPQRDLAHNAGVFESPLSPSAALSASLPAKPEEVDATYHQVASVDPLMDAFSYFPSHADLPFPLLGSGEQDDVALADPMIGVSM